MITRYEISAVHPDGRKYLIAYTPRVSRPGLFVAIQERSAAILNRLGIPADSSVKFNTRPHIHAVTEQWIIGFTGRTQVEARHNKLPYVGDAPTAQQSDQHDAERFDGLS